MSACCDPNGLGRMFGDRFARRSLRRYRRKGLDPTARRMVAWLRARGLVGAEVVEIGGGIGFVAHELLEAGAARAVNVEISPAYAHAAAELDPRVEQRLGDVVAEPTVAGDADVVVLHRVVCCYPDGAALVGAAAARARRSLVLSYPTRAWWLLATARIANAALAAIGREYRIYPHARETLVAAAEDGGLRLAHESRRAVWRLAAFDRA